MTLRKQLLSGMALATTLLLVLSGCYFDITWWTPDPEPVPEPAPLFEFSLEWTQSSSVSPHLYLTYPAPLDGDTTDGEDLASPIDNTPTFTEPFTPLNQMGGGDLGFVPDDIATGAPDEGTDTRGTVYYGNPESFASVLGDPAVELIDANVDSESIALRGFPFASSSTTVSTTGGAITGLPTSSGYTWVGVMEVYAYATSGQLEYDSGVGGVDALLNVFKNGVPYVTYRLPEGTDLKGISIVRINCFYEGNTEVYQFVPDLRVIQSTTQIRSVAPGGEIDESGIITFRNPVSE